MHPNAAFGWTDRNAMLEFAAEQSFAHIFTASENGQFVVHAPLLFRQGSPLFHVAKRNRIAGELDGQPVLISILGRHAYHSANWYVSDDQVPTWHYEAVEIEGVARRISDEQLVEFLDQLTGVMERRSSPDRPWTRAKMAPGKFEAMTKAIVGFEVEPTEIRGTRKFNQSKSDGDLEATISGQRSTGREDIVEAIKECRFRGK
ncbi:MAG TPA: FMN-binding negative transcriptional regulator [Sphingomicrobium sp.]|nr:FMN-binding negative transcriptional regulator [Sphingomicrobium sp.]